MVVTIKILKQHFDVLYHRLHYKDSNFFLNNHSIIEIFPDF